jgi:hypothetical protein
MNKLLPVYQFFIKKFPPYQYFVIDIDNYLEINK